MGWLRPNTRMQMSALMMDASWSEGQELQSATKVSSLVVHTG